MRKLLNNTKLLRTLQSRVAGSKASIVSALRKNPAFLVTLIFAAILVAPVFTFTPSFESPSIPGVPSLEANVEPSGDNTAVNTADNTVDDSAGTYFDPDDYEIVDYTRSDLVLMNRGTAVDSEDLMFGSVSEEDMVDGLKPPPDMTFRDDSTTIYVHYAPLNMRALPSTESEILRKFNLGDSFLRTGIGPEWDRIVDSNGTTGYVFNEFVKTAKPTPTPTPAPKYSAPAKANTLGEAIAKEAQRYLGVRYRWSAEDPDVGFDCSGLTWYVYNRYGIDTPRGTSSYANAGTLISYSQIMPGDVIAWDTERYDGRKTITHVGIYVGNGMMVHASSSNRKVVMVSVAQYRQWETLISIHRFHKK
jgi:cell wall-associated NlpC family hydrolase